MHTYKKKPSYTSKVPYKSNSEFLQCFMSYKVLDQEVEIVVLEENLNWVNFSSKL
jgi:hypothetical protein